MDCGAPPADCEGRSQHHRFYFCARYTEGVSLASLVPLASLTSLVSLAQSGIAARWRSFRHRAPKNRRATFPPPIAITPAPPIPFFAVLILQKKSSFLQFSQCALGIFKNTDTRFALHTNLHLRQEKGRGSLFVIAKAPNLHCIPSMAGKLRIERSGVLHHVTNRGNYRADILATDGARQAFVKTLGEACQKTGWMLHAWCLMTNPCPYHLALQTPKANLVSGMQWLQATLGARFNRFRKKRGRLFRGRYKALNMEPGRALGAVCHYIPQSKPYKISQLESGGGRNDEKNNDHEQPVARGATGHGQHAHDEQPCQQLPQRQARCNSLQPPDLKMQNPIWLIILTI